MPTHPAAEADAGGERGVVVDDDVVGEDHLRHDRDVRPDGDVGGQGDVRQHDGAGPMVQVEPTLAAGCTTVA